mmetsp:Transcript_6486/g.20159  ORF Transcript_6486/g.20159 Transcript_6486/m.20159 type:complete len:212 (-) Transcript_6486:460-1095(-)
MCRGLGRPCAKLPRRRPWRHRGGKSLHRSAAVVLVAAVSGQRPHSRGRCRYPGLWPGFSLPSPRSCCCPCCSASAPCSSQALAPSRRPCEGPCDLPWASPSSGLVTSGTSSSSSPGKPCCCSCGSASSCPCRRSAASALRSMQRARHSSSGSCWRRRPSRGTTPRPSRPSRSAAAPGQSRRPGDEQGSRTASGRRRAVAREGQACMARLRP